MLSGWTELQDRSAGSDMLTEEGVMNWVGPQCLHDKTVQEWFVPPHVTPRNSYILTPLGMDWQFLTLPFLSLRSDPSRIGFGGCAERHSRSEGQIIIWRFLAGSWLGTLSPLRCTGLLPSRGVASCHDLLSGEISLSIGTSCSSEACNPFSIPNVHSFSTKEIPKRTQSQEGIE